MFTAAAIFFYVFKMIDYGLRFPWPPAGQINVLGLKYVSVAHCGIGSVVASHL